MSEPMELSCYTANLVAYLEAGNPDIARDLAAAVRLSVRTDPPEGGLAFSHHTRVDRDGSGRALAYRGAPDWSEARAALTAELDRHGRVLLVGNTRFLPWSPAYERSETPHWLLVQRDADDMWSVRDDFEALTPHGEQAPYSGQFDDEGLRRLATPPEGMTPEAANRDRYALGLPVDLPSPTGYRWLVVTDPETEAETEAETGAATDAAADAEQGAWVHGTAPALRCVAERLCADDGALARHADDVWTASRHQRHRLALLPAAGDKEAAAAAEAAAAWGELPRAVRFAIASAERGRPRRALVEKAFTAVLDAVERLEDTKGGTTHDG
ncbi:hypothetical protein AB0B50_42815 [Streptomyces sp. NPDC041068]|uniref:hypothetical protein n=1 Tax=Streptomyces sp. NPDC041068 TaxID=3155130 RepID=UPI0034032733